MSEDLDGNIRILNKLDEIAAQRRSNVGDSQPYILVVIDDIMALIERQPEIADRLISAMRDYRKYRISFIATANNAINLRFKVLQVLERKLLLGNYSVSELRDIGAKSPLYATSNNNGRGAFVLNSEPVEFQTAVVAAKKDDEINRIDEICCRVESINNNYKIYDVPSNQNYQAFYERFKANGIIPLGYFVDDLAIWSLPTTKGGAYTISAVHEKSTSLMMNNIAYSLRAAGKKWIVVSLKSSIMFNKTGSLEIYSKNRIVDFISDLELELADIEEDENGIIVVIDSLNDLCEFIYDSEEPQLSLRAEKVFKRAIDSNCILIAGVEEAIYTKLFNKPLCRLFTAVAKGIHLGGCLNKQHIFDFKVPIELKSKSESYNYGHVIEDNVTRKVFVPQQ